MGADWGMEGEQRSLFSVREVASVPYGQRVTPLAMSATALTTWKQRVWQFQQTVREELNAAQQGSLFGDLPSATEVAIAIDPFALPRQNVEFWRWSVEDAGVSAYYFVIDYEVPLLLYVGETVKSNQRWKGEHDCKRYIENYISAHRQAGVPTTVGIAFHHWAPTATRPRQQLETALILQWRSPFNKQNWVFWGTPFVGGQ